MTGMPLFLIVSLFLSSVGRAEESLPYVDELISHVSEKRLWDSREWQLLLHYKKGWLGGVESEADGRGFFTARDGNKNPRADLEATLRSFFDADRTDPEWQHSQCRFPARYRWLKSELSFDPKRLPEKECPKFDSWRGAMNPSAVTLIFASYYMNNPASMFGHTLLRLDHGAQTGRGELLDYSISYAAVTGNEGGLLWAIKGMTGGYPGSFSSFPYYFKVREYGNFESRDIWEYHLNFTQDQIDRMLAHLWELGSTYFDYFFFDENCSYHLLSLLEVADPRLDLRSAYHVYVAPSDTVKQIARQPGLVSSVTYRPSLRTRLYQKWEALTPPEKDLVGPVEKGNLADRRLAGLPEARRALVLDTALDHLEFLRGRQPMTGSEEKLLTERSRLGGGVEVKNRPLSTSPAGGHNSTQTGFSFGGDQTQTFEEFRFRGVYHDLMASDDGYPPDAQIELLKLRLRFLNSQRKLHVENFTAADVVSLAPWTALEKKPSWNVSIGIDTLRNGQCGACNVGFLEGGAGLAFESRLLNRETFFIFADLLFQGGPSVEGAVRVGPKVWGGLLVRWTCWWGSEVSGSFDYTPISERSRDYRGSFENRFTLARDWELRFEATKFKKGEEAVGTLLYYF